MSRSHTRRTILLGAVGALLLPSRANGAVTYSPLFRIERSKNANVVQYDAVCISPDRLDPKRPVVGYWILYAEDGRREGLSGLGYRAYGFRVVPEATGSWLLYLNATRDRSIRVVFWRGRWIAQAVVAGRSAVLERLFVATDEGAFLPRVKWVDLFGVDMITNEALTERIKG